MTAKRAREIPGRAAVARRKEGQAPGEPRSVAYLYVLPGLAAYLAFTFFPLLQTVRLSFYEWDGLSPKKWVGLDNYRELGNTPASSTGGPIRSLIGFQRVSLKAGEKKIVRFDVAPRQFATVDTGGRVVAAPGTFEITAGGKQPGFSGLADASTTSVVSGKLLVGGAPKELD